MPQLWVKLCHSKGDFCIAYKLVMVPRQRKNARGRSIIEEVMDPVSQGVVGAAFAQAAAKRTTLATVAWYGALGGMAPDLDVLFQSPTDPILFLEFHRQFTHSLVFIPIGALLVFAVCDQSPIVFACFKASVLDKLIWRV